MRTIEQIRRARRIRWAIDAAIPWAVLAVIVILHLVIVHHVGVI